MEITVTGYPMSSNTDCIGETREITIDFNKLFDTPFHFALDNVKQNGVYLVMGFVFNLKPHLNNYLAKTIDGDWREYYAPNVKLLRKSNCDKFIKVIKL